MNEIIDSIFYSLIPTFILWGNHQIILRLNDDDDDYYYYYYSYYR